MLLSTIALTIFFILLGSFFLIRSSGVSLDAILWAPLVILSSFVCIHALGIGTSTWIVMGEILDQSVKDVAVGFAVTVSFTLSILVSLLFPYLSANVGDGWTFVIFSTFSAVSSVLIYASVPETKGRTLEEIQELLKKKK